MQQEQEFQIEGNSKGPEIAFLGRDGRESEGNKINEDIEVWLPIGSRKGRLTGEDGREVARIDMRDKTRIAGARCCRNRLGRRAFIPRTLQDLI